MGGVAGEQCESFYAVVGKAEEDIVDLTVATSSSELRKEVTSCFQCEACNAFDIFSPQYGLSLFGKEKLTFCRKTTVRH